MARPGVTYQDVVNAANELKGQNKNVTIENVRAILGTGSIGTINNHLRKWKTIQDSSHKIAAKENLPEELISLLKGLWEGVVTQSTERFIPIEEALQQEILDLKTELEKYKTNNQRWQQLFNQWQQEKTKLVNDKLTLEQALEFKQKENDALTIKQDHLLQQLQEKQARIDELHRLHKQSQDNLEHYRESAREQRLQDQQQHEQQKQQLQFEIKTLTGQLVMQREKTLSFQQQHQILQLSFTASEKNYAEAQVQLQQVNAELKETEKAKTEFLSASQNWQNQYQALEKILNEKTNQLIDSETEAKLLSQQLIDSKQALSATQDQNKLLAHEKWDLIQEKSQLEGQLKQMQKTIIA